MASNQWVIVLAFTVLIALASADLLKSRATMTESHAISSIPLSALADPNIGFLVTASFYGGGLRSDDVGNCLIHGWEHGPAAAPYLFNTIRTQKRVPGGLLSDVSILFSGVGEATQNVAISPVASRPYIVRSWRLGTTFFATVYGYDVDSCVINPTPLTQFSFASLHADFFGGVRTFNSFAGFSDDGKFLEYVLTLGANGTAYATTYGFMELSGDGLTLTDIVQFAPPTPSNGFYYPQPNVILRADSDSGTPFYHVINAHDNFVPGDPYAATVDSRLCAYRFYPSPAAVVETGCEASPQFIQNVEMSADLSDIWYTTNNMGIYGRSADQIPRQPYANGADDTYSEFRHTVYSKNAITDSLAFEDSTDSDCFGLALRLSRDGKILFHSCSYEILPLTAVPGVGYFPSFGAGVLQSYRVKGNTLDLQDSVPTPPLALNISPSLDGNYVTVVGMPSINKKDIVNYAVTKTH